MDIAYTPTEEPRVEESIGSVDFTQDWFSRHIPVWEQLIPTLPACDKFLEIGSFEGRASCWMLEHGLSPNGELYCIDTWAGSPEFWAMPPEIVKKSFDRFKRNIAITRKATQGVFIFRNESWKALGALIGDQHDASFDLIYVDGGHHAHQVLSDAIMAWPLLKPGGLMVFDDYLWDLQEPPTKRPKLGIDMFLALFFDQLQTEAVGHQYIVRKKEVVE